MKKIIFTLIFIAFSFAISVGRVSAQLADGQSCHDGSECASGMCDSQQRVCVPNGQTGNNDLSVTDDVLDQFDPLKIGDSEFQEQFSTPGGIISRVLEFAFPIAGIILFLMLVVGGLQILMAAGNDKGMQAGQQRATFAVIGFLLLFASYWVAVLLGQILGIKIV